MGDLAKDLDRIYGVFGSGSRTPLAKAKLWLLNSELHCVVCYRYGQFANRLRERNRLLGTAVVATHRVWNRWVTHIDHTEISTRAQIGPGLLVMHRHGIDIGPVQIGKNCVIHHNLTIGQGVAAGDHSVPTIGDNVWIGPGVILSGGIHIGDGATISAGTVLSRDVPARALVAGNPGRVIAQDYDNSSIMNLPDEAPSQVPQA